MNLSLKDNLFEYIFFKDNKLELNTSIEIINVLELDEVISKMTLQLKLTVEWIDSRLEYINLKSDQNLNRLTPQETQDIWMPKLVFSNTKMRQEVDFKNKSTFASIRINEGTQLFLFTKVTLNSNKIFH